jgi:competence ComEA-like helix-hairpin-helix protein
MVEPERGKKTKGQVNLNRASLEDLAKLPMVGRDRAEKLIQYRNDHGEIRNWEELEHVASFSKGMIEDLKQGGVTL